MKDSKKLCILGLIVFISGVFFLNLAGKWGDVGGGFIMGTGFGVLASTASISRLEKKIPKNQQLR